jgi:DNA-binding CsgD family transcriptional regulator
MLAPEAWVILPEGEVPERYEEVDAEFTAALEALPVYTASDFSPRQLEIAQLAIQELDRPRSADAVGITDGTMRKHRDNVFDKIGARSISHFVYVCLDNGLLDYKPDPQLILLTPGEAIVLKGLSLGLKVPALTEKMGYEVRYDAGRLNRKMDAHSQPVTVSRAYQRGLYVPRSFRQQT